MHSQGLLTCWPIVLLCCALIMDLVNRWTSWYLSSWCVNASQDYVSPFFHRTSLRCFIWSLMENTKWLICECHGSRSFGQSGSSSGLGQWSMVLIHFCKCSALGEWYVYPILTSFSICMCQAALCITFSSFQLGSLL